MEPYYYYNPALPFYYFQNPQQGSNTNHSTNQRHTSNNNQLNHLSTDLADFAWNELKKVSKDSLPSNIIPKIENREFLQIFYELNMPIAYSIYISTESKKEFLKKIKVDKNIKKELIDEFLKFNFLGIENLEEPTDLNLDFIPYELLRYLRSKFIAKPGKSLLYAKGNYARKLQAFIILDYVQKEVLKKEKDLWDPQQAYHLFFEPSIHIHFEPLNNDQSTWKLIYSYLINRYNTDPKFESLFHTLIEICLRSSSMQSKSHIVLGNIYGLNLKIDLQDAPMQSVSCSLESVLCPLDALIPLVNEPFKQPQSFICQKPFTYSQYASDSISKVMHLSNQENFSIKSWVDLIEYTTKGFRCPDATIFHDVTDKMDKTELSLKIGDYLKRKPLIDSFFLILNVFVNLSLRDAPDTIITSMWHDFEKNLLTNGNIIYLISELKKIPHGNHYLYLINILQNSECSFNLALKMWLLSDCAAVHTQNSPNKVLFLTEHLGVSVQHKGNANHFVPYKPLETCLELKKMVLPSDHVQNLLQAFIEINLPLNHFDPSFAVNATHQNINSALDYNSLEKASLELLSSSINCLKILGYYQLMVCQTRSPSLTTQKVLIEEFPQIIELLESQTPKYQILHSLQIIANIDSNIIEHLRSCIGHIRNLKDEWILLLSTSHNKTVTEVSAEILSKCIKLENSHSSKSWVQYVGIPAVEKLKVHNRREALKIFLLLQQCKAFSNPSIELKLFSTLVKDCPIEDYGRLEKCASWLVENFPNKSLIDYSKELLEVAKYKIRIKESPKKIIESFLIPALEKGLIDIKFENLESIFLEFFETACKQEPSTIQDIFVLIEKHGILKAQNLKEKTNNFIIEFLNKDEELNDPIFDDIALQLIGSQHEKVWKRWDQILDSKKREYHSKYITYFAKAYIKSHVSIDNSEKQISEKICFSLFNKSNPSLIQKFFQKIIAENYITALAFLNSLHSKKVLQTLDEWGLFILLLSEFEKINKLNKEDLELLTSIVLETIIKLPKSKVTHHSPNTSFELIQFIHYLLSQKYVESARKMMLTAHERHILPYNEKTEKLWMGLLRSFSFEKIDDLKQVYEIWKKIPEFKNIDQENTDRYSIIIDIYTQLLNHTDDSLIHFKQSLFTLLKSIELSEAAQKIIREGILKVIPTQNSVQGFKSLHSNKDFLDTDSFYNMYFSLLEKHLEVDLNDSINRLKTLLSKPDNSYYEKFINVKIPELIQKILTSNKESNITLTSLDKLLEMLGSLKIDQNGQCSLSNILSSLCLHPINSSSGIKISQMLLKNFEHTKKLEADLFIKFSHGLCDLIEEKNNLLSDKQKVLQPLAKVVTDFITILKENDLSKNTYSLALKLLQNTIDYDDCIFVASEEHIKNVAWIIGKLIKEKKFIEYKGFIYQLLKKSIFKTDNILYNSSLAMLYKDFIHTIYQSDSQIALECLKEITPSLIRVDFSTENAMKEVYLILINFFKSQSQHIKIKEILDILANKANLQTLSILTFPKETALELLSSNPQASAELLIAYHPFIKPDDSFTPKIEVLICHLIKNKKDSSLIIDLMLHYNIVKEEFLSILDLRNLNIDYLLKFDQIVAKTIESNRYMNKPNELVLVLIKLFEIPNLNLHHTLSKITMENVIDQCTIVEKQIELIKHYKNYLQDNLSIEKYTPIIFSLLSKIDNEKLKEPLLGIKLVVIEKVINGWYSDKNIEILHLICKELYTLSLENIKVPINQLFFEQLILSTIIKWCCCGDFENNDSPIIAYLSPLSKYLMKHHINKNDQIEDFTSSYVRKNHISTIMLLANTRNPILLENAIEGLFQLLNFPALDDQGKIIECTQEQKSDLADTFQNYCSIKPFSSLTADILNHKNLLKLVDQTTKETMLKSWLILRYKDSGLSLDEFKEHLPFLPNIDLSDFTLPVFSRIWQDFMQSKIILTFYKNFNEILKLIARDKRKETIDSDPEMIKEIEGLKNPSEPIEPPIVCYKKESPQFSKAVSICIKHMMDQQPWPKDLEIFLINAIELSIYSLIINHQSAAYDYWPLFRKFLFLPIWNTESFKQFKNRRIKFFTNLVRYKTFEKNKNGVLETEIYLNIPQKGIINRELRSKAVKNLIGFLLTESTPHQVKEALQFLKDNHNYFDNQSEIIEVLNDIMDKIIPDLFLSENEPNSNSDEDYLQIYLNRQRLLELIYESDAKWSPLASASYIQKILKFVNSSELPALKRFQYLKSSFSNLQRGLKCSKFLNMSHVLYDLVPQFLNSLKIYSEKENIKNIQSHFSLSDFFKITLNSKTIKESRVKAFNQWLIFLYNQKSDEALKLLKSEYAYHTNHENKSPMYIGFKNEQEAILKLLSQKT